MKILTYVMGNDAEIAVDLGRKKGLVVSVMQVGRGKVEITVRKTKDGCPGTSNRHEFKKVFGRNR